MEALEKYGTAGLYDFIAIQIRKKRRERGMTQEVLGDLTARAKQTICDIEHARIRIDAETLLLVADALDISPNELLGYKKDN